MQLATAKQRFYTVDKFGDNCPSAIAGRPMMHAKNAMEIKVLEPVDNVLRAAIRQAGGPSKFAALVGVTPAAVTQWVKLANLPFEHLPLLAERSSYSVRELMDYVAYRHPRYARLATHFGPAAGKKQPKIKPPPRALDDGNQLSLS